MSARAFRIHASDNVATMLDDASSGESVTILGAAGDGDARVVAAAPVARAHKIALSSLQPGAAVLKFGVRIGHATQPVAAGDWVHLHNLASDHDKRSGTLDLHSGAPADTASAYV
jgi:hypothetical protein